MLSLANLYLRAGLIALILAMLATGPAHEALAAGVVGDGTPGSCTEAALDAALGGGGAISFDCGGPTTITITNRKTIVLDTSIDGGGTITLSGGTTTKIFVVDPAASLTLTNITLDSANSPTDNGGAIYAGGPLTLLSVTIQHSQVGPNGCGGAVLIANAATIADSTFTDNSAGYDGGAICVGSSNTGNVSIVRSLFVGNRSVDVVGGVKGFGGAIYVADFSHATVIDTAFVSNAAHFGGAVYVRPNSTVVMQGSATSSLFASKLQLNANSATEDGGAIYNKGGTLAVANALLTVNKAPMQTILAGYGGAIYSEGVLNLSNSLISQNEGRFGGGVFIGAAAAASATIDRTTFRQNTSGSLGGGLYTNNATTAITVTDSAFLLNSAGTGGGIAVFNANLHLLNSSLTQNTATSGGGFYNGAGPNATDGHYVHVESVTISGNTASSNQGGGVLTAGRIELYSTTIVSNTNGVFSSNGGNTRFRNTVLQNPSSLNCDGDGTAQISDDARNFSTDNSCDLPSSQTGIGLDPRLDVLTLDPLGLTYYHLPLPGSPLIDAGFSGINCPTFDQRGATRVGECDIGAVEYGGLQPRIYLPLVREK